MRLYPTIHIKNGRCFNPAAAQADKQNIFTSSPVKLAKIWEDAGASFLHIVDVDGAMMGFPVHDELIHEIVETVNIPIQAGGGIRSIKDIDHMLGLGLERVVCGTEAVKNNRFVEEAIASFGSEHFVAGIDAVNGMGRCGVKTVVYTDILSSSLHQGPSIDNTRELVARTEVGIIYAGGISCLADLEAISSLDVDGIIIASALYSGAIDLKEAINIFEKGLAYHEN